MPQNRSGGQQQLQPNNNDGDQRQLLNETIRSKLHQLHEQISATRRAALYAAYTKQIVTSGSGDGHRRQPAQPSPPPPAEPTHNVIAYVLIALGIILAIIIAQPVLTHYILGIRCFVPNNYLIWEATRPVSDCSYCRGIDGPLILPNMTRDSFRPYAYSVQPIILKNAVAHWTARTQLNYTVLRSLYRRHVGDLHNFHDECQFLNFKSNFLTLEQFFSMPEERANSGRPPWYVGFSNCQPAIIAELRQYYPIPHFLPADAEIPNTDYIFLGYEQGAIMHVSNGVFFTFFFLNNFCFLY